MLEYYGTKKLMYLSRTLHFLSLKGEAREVIIVPELAINAGWRDMAFKIEGFMYHSIAYSQTKFKASYSEI